MRARRVEKHLKKTENFDMGVQSFGNDSKTNQDIKNRNSSLTSTINSEDNDINVLDRIMTLTFIGLLV